jgi:hypothetical protein
MIVEGKAVKDQCLSQYCQSLKLTATTPQQAQFLAFLHRIIALGGGSVTVDSLTGAKVTLHLPLNTGEPEK